MAQQVWIERNRTLTGLPYGVIWYTSKGKEVRYFATLDEARQRANKAVGKRGVIVEDHAIEHGYK